MILLIDLCWKENSLSSPEFVDPIANIVKSSGEQYRIIHHLSADSRILKESRGIILCGTALKDNGFRSNVRLMEIIRDTDLPVLGICAGMQVIALAFGSKLEDSLEIGMDDIKITGDDEVLNEEMTIRAYKLHGMRIIPDEKFIILAKSGKGPESIRHISRPVWGVLFHPEVRNEWVVGNFVSYCRRLAPADRPQNR